jgi:O-antigen/teichoic acid export membrane protein
LSELRTRMEKTSKEIIKGSFWLYSAVGLSLAISVVTTIVLARLLDKELWGIFASTIALTSFLTTFYDFGINYSVTHQVAKSKGKNRGVINILLKYKILLTLLVALIIFFASDWIAEMFRSPGSGIYFRISAAFFFLFNVFSFFDNIFLGLKSFKLSSTNTFLFYMLRFLFAAILVYLGFGVTGALGGYILSLVIVTAIQIYFLRKIVSINVFETRKDEISLVIASFSYGFYIGIASIAASITAWTDTIMIGLFIGTTAVGVYKLAVSISSAIGSFIATLNRVIFPILSEKDKRKADIAAMNNIIKYGSFIVIPASVGLALSSFGIVNVFLGPQYLEASVPLIILSYLVFDSFIFGAFVSFFAAKGETKFVGKVTILSALLNVIFNAILIPLLGIVGAAIASVFTRILSLIFVILKCQKEKLFFDFSGMIKPFIGSTAMALALIVLSSILPIFILDNIFSLIAFVIVGGIVYLLVEFLIGFDISFILKILDVLKSERVWNKFLHRT